MPHLTVRTSKKRWNTFFGTESPVRGQLKISSDSSQNGYLERSGHNGSREWYSPLQHIDAVNASYQVVHNEPTKSLGTSHQKDTWNFSHALFVTNDNVIMEVQVRASPPCRM